MGRKARVGGRPVPVPRLAATINFAISGERADTAAIDGLQVAVSAHQAAADSKLELEVAVLGVERRSDREVVDFRHLQLGETDEKADIVSTASHGLEGRARRRLVAIPASARDGERLKDAFCLHSEDGSLSIGELRIVLIRSDTALGFEQSLQS